MIVIGERSGFSFWRYDIAMDENTWSLNIGWGGKVPNRPYGVISPMFRYQISAEWRPLATCFEWWSEFLGVERGRGVVIQHRIHSFRRWPVSLRFWWTNEDSVGESAGMHQMSAPDRGAAEARPRSRLSVVP